MLNNNLAYYLIKSSVDGDILQLFWITQKAKSFGKKAREKTFKKS